MVASQYLSRMTLQQYLEWEPTQELRYEYVNGQVFAMTGGTIPHNTIAVNLVTALKSHLRGGPCQVFVADVKVGISADGPFHYPDVLVSCDERDQDAIQVIQYPCLIVEVLSPSTEAYDRGGKFAHYRQLTTLQEYVLIEAEKIGVECFRRTSNGRQWEFQTYSVGEEVELESVDFRCPMELLYEGVRFSQSSL